MKCHETLLFTCFGVEVGDRVKTTIFTCFRGLGHEKVWFHRPHHHETPLFTALLLCFRGAETIKISIFGYPESLIKQLSSQAAAMMAAKQLKWQLSISAGAS